MERQPSFQEGFISPRHSYSPKRRSPSTAPLSKEEAASFLNAYVVYLENPKNRAIHQTEDGHFTCNEQRDVTEDIDRLMRRLLGADLNEAYASLHQAIIAAAQHKKRRYVFYNTTRQNFLTAKQKFSDDKTFVQLSVQSAEALLSYFRENLAKLDHRDPSASFQTATAALGHVGTNAVFKEDAKTLKGRLARGVVARSGASLGKLHAKYGQDALAEAERRYSQIETAISNLEELEKLKEGNGAYSRASEGRDILTLFYYAFVGEAYEHLDLRDDLISETPIEAAIDALIDKLETKVREQIESFRFADKEGADAREEYRATRIAYLQAKERDLQGMDKAARILGKQPGRNK